MPKDHPMPPLVRRLFIFLWSVVIVGMVIGFRFLGGHAGVPLVPLWVDILPAVGAIAFFCVLMARRERLRTIGAEPSFRSRFQLLLLSTLGMFVVLILLNLSMDIGMAISQVPAFLMMCLVAVGIALIGAAWTQRLGDWYACAKCGYPRPEQQSETCTVCTECGHRWWLPGGAVRAKRAPMWRVVWLGAAIIVVGVVLTFTIGLQRRGPLQRAIVALVPTDRLTRAATTSYPGSDEALFLDTLLSRSLSAEQQDRLARGLVDQFVRYQSLSPTAIEWLETRIGAHAIPEEIRARYLEKVAPNLGFRLGQIPISHVSNDTLFVGATTGGIGVDEDACLRELLNRGLTDAMRERLMLALLDHRRAEDDLGQVADGWLETEAIVGDMPDEIRERYFSEMFSFWLEGADTATVGEPYRVVVASRDRRGFGANACRIWVCYGGVSIDGGMTWTDSALRWRDAQMFGNLRYRRSHAPYTIGDKAPAVTFNAPGQWQVMMRLRLVALPRSGRPSAVEWNTDGSLKLPPGAVWSKEILIDHAVKVEERSAGGDSSP